MDPIAKILGDTYATVERKDTTMNRLVDQMINQSKESKIISRKKKLNQAFFQEDFIQVPKHNMLPPEYDYQHADTRHHPYMDSNKYENDNRLKLVVLCHSTAIEEQDFGPYK